MKYLIFFVLAILFACSSGDDGRLVKNQSDVSLNPFDSVNTLIKAEPSDANLYFQRAKLHYAQRDLPASLADVGRALKLDSSNADYYLLFADLKLISKESRESRDALITALRFNPNNIDVLIKLGELYMIVQDSDHSFEYLNRALKLDVYNGRAYQIKGFNYMYLGDTANAVSSFETAIEQDPQDYESYMQLGFFYANIQDDLALDYFNNALKVNPTSLEALYAKGLFLQTIEKSREAIGAYRAMLDIRESQTDAWYNQGYVYLEQLAVYDSAAYCFTRALDFGPAVYPNAVYNRGLAHERAQDFPKAEADYRAALEMDPQYDLAAIGLERILE